MLVLSQLYIPYVEKMSVKNLQYLFSLFNLPLLDFIVVMCMLANGMDPDEMLYNAAFHQGI